MSRLTRSTLATLALALALATGLVTAQDYRIEQPFVNHMQLGLHEQDVFVAQGDAAYRATAETSDDAALHAAASSVPHNPADLDDVGPYPLGPELGFSLASWLGATGDMKLTCVDGAGHLEIVFDALVPDATYTLWTSYAVMPVTVPFSVIDIPLGAMDGSQNAFTTDARGHADVSVALDVCPILSREPLATAIAVAYHSDGLTHGFSPGRFGHDSHVQLVTFLPTPAQLDGAASLP